MISKKELRLANEHLTRELDKRGRRITQLEYQNDLLTAILTNTHPVENPKIELPE